MNLSIYIISTSNFFRRPVPTPMKCVCMSHVRLTELMLVPPSYRPVPSCGYLTVLMFGILASTTFQTDHCILEGDKGWKLPFIVVSIIVLLTDIVFMVVSHVGHAYLSRFTWLTHTPHTHAHTHTHTHTHTHMHTLTNTQTHIHTQIQCTILHTYTHLHSLIH